MSQQRYYTTQLQAGLGLLEETRQLLQVYQPGMSASQLYEAALASGRFPLVTARRLRNIVAECFAPRYMRDPLVADRLKSAGIRVEVDSSDDRMQKKIRNHTIAKVPYIVIAGEEDRANGAVSFRYRNGEQENGIPVDEAIARIKQAIDSRAIED